MGAYSYNVVIAGLIIVNGIGVHQYLANTTHMDRVQFAPVDARPAVYAVDDIYAAPEVNGGVYHGGGVNARDQLTTSTGTGNSSHPAIWTERARIDLPLVKSVNGAGSMGINNAGDVIGYLFSDPVRAAEWRHQDRSHPYILPLLPGYTRSEAWAISNNGSVAGRLYAAPGSKEPWYAERTHACAWFDGKAHDLGVPPGCISSRAYGINDARQVVGWTLTSRHRMCAFLYENGAIHCLEGLPGGHVSRASAINRNGLVVGDADDAEGAIHAVIWNGGKIEDLGFPAGCGWAKPTGINSRADIVGITSGSRIFVWDASHGMRLVHRRAQDVIHQLQYPIGITDDGTLAIAGRNDGQFEWYFHRLFLLRPVG